MTENERVTINGKEVTLYREVETNLYRFSKDAVDMLLEALEEREQYRAIGTIEEFKALKEKNTAKKPKNRYKTRYMWDGAYCPDCNCGITARWNFCQSCGSRIDWSE